MPARHVVACPRAYRPAEEIGIALASVGALEAYVTGFRWKDGPLEHAVERLLPRRVRTSLARRTLKNVPADRLHSYRTLDMGRAALATLKLPLAADWAWEIEDHVFDRRVAHDWVRPGFVVHTFEHCALATLRRAKAVGAKSILHLPSVHPNFNEHVLDRELARFPEIGETSDARRWARRARRDARRIREFDAADLVVTYSPFATQTLTDGGVPAEKIISVPIAAPEFEPLAAKPSTGAGLTVLFAGLVNVRKGAHYLLDAWERAYRPGDRLLLAGQYGLPERWAERPGVEKLGPVPQRTLFELMASSDVMVFPTLCDSYGMVIAEALAHGLPVVTTPSAGASELIVEGKNGWIVPPADVDALTSRLRACAANVEELRAMRAKITASGMGVRTWPQYHVDFRHALAARGLL